MRRHYLLELDGGYTYTLQVVFERIIFMLFVCVCFVAFSIGRTYRTFWLLPLHIIVAYAEVSLRF